MKLLLIIGGAVGKVVSSLVADIMMPLISLAIPGGNWREAPLWPGFGRYRSLAICFELLGQYGEALDAYTRNPWLRNSLRMMRGPALVARLSQLQHFLEAGFDTFRAMRGAASFLAMIGQRERALKDGLFAADTVACVTAASRSSDGILGW